MKLKKMKVLQGFLRSSTVDSMTNALPPTNALPLLLERVPQKSDKNIDDEQWQKKVSANLLLTSECVGWIFFS